MGTKYLETKTWATFVKKHKVKDPGVATALNVFWDCQPPAYEGRLAALDKIIAFLKKLQKDKVVVAEKLALDYVNAMLKDVLAEKKKVAAENKKYEAKMKKEGAKEVNIQFVIRNFLKEPMGAHKAFIEFKAPGADKVTLAKPIKGGVVSFKGIELTPIGTVRLMAISTNGGKVLPTGVISYKLKGDKTITFLAQQGFKTIKVKARSATEMAKKAGLKGSAGLEFQIIKVGGEAFTEKETKVAREDEVEWEVQIATADFAMKMK